MKDKSTSVQTGFCRLSYRVLNAKTNELKECLLVKVWKFHDFSLTHILCEIKIGDSRSEKSGIFSTFRRFDFYDFLALFEG